MSRHEGIGAGSAHRVPPGVVGGFIGVVVGEMFRSDVVFGGVSRSEGMHAGSAHSSGVLGVWSGESVVEVVVLVVLVDLWLFGVVGGVVVVVVMVGEVVVVVGGAVSVVVLAFARFFLRRD